MESRILKILSAVLMVTLIFVIPIYAGNAQYIYSRVLFTVPVSNQFQITLAGAGSANISTGTLPGNSTEDIWFNASNQNSKYVDPCRVGGSSCQVRFTTPIAQVKNIGTGSFNVSIMLNTSQDATLKLWGNWSNITDMSTCTGWTLGANDTVIVTSTRFNFTKAMCPNNATNVWLWANFSNTPVGTITNYINWTSDDA